MDYQTVYFKLNGVYSMRRFAGFNPEDVVPAGALLIDQSEYQTAVDASLAAREA